MRKGNVVTIYDYSYSKRIVNSKLVEVNDRGKKYIVIETECRFPLEKNYQRNEYRNDTIIQNVDNEEIIFIHGRFLRPVVKVREVTMAEVCAQFGEEVKIRKEQK